MAPLLKDHRRSFVKTTFIAFCGLALLLVLLGSMGTTVGPFHWAWVGEHLSAWEIKLAAVVSTVILTGLSAYAALVAIGGVVVLHRDACEERGVPYTPRRPRERIMRPRTAALRRFFRLRAGLRPGETVEVRSVQEILATLDDRGCLDGLPFMPEMVKYCGGRFEVHRRVSKVWEYAHATGLRRFHSAVLLKAIRCDGTSHGGCQAACQLIWKEAWLKPPTTRGETFTTAARIDLGTHTQTTIDGARRYVCQMTEIIRASTRLPNRDLTHYWRDLMDGNVRVAPLLVVLGVRLFNGVSWRLSGVVWPVLGHLESETSPHQELGLQPGDLVRVKSKHAIEATLNRKRCNRGLEFGLDQLFCCGGSYRVAARVDRVVSERTGELLELKTPSITLEGAHANGGLVLTPQNEYFFWREIWLEPQSRLKGNEGVS